MTRKRIRTAVGIFAAACTVLIAAGCSPQEQQDLPEPAPAPTVTVTATPTPEPAPTPEPITCQTAFTVDLYMKLETDGLTFRGAGSSGDIDEIVGADGLRCQWTKPQTDLTVRYATWTRDAAAWDALKAQLLEDQYSEAGPFAITRQVADRDSAYRYRDGVIHYASPSRFIGWVSEFQ